MKKMFGSMRVQIIVLCLFSMVVMQVTLISNYQQSRELKIQDNHERFQELLEQVAFSVESNCIYLNDILEQIAYSSEVQAYLENANLDYRRSHQAQILSLLTSMSKLRSGIKDIAILDAVGNCTNLNGNIYQVQKLADEIPENGLYYYTGLKEFQMANGAQKIDCFIVGAQIYSTSDFTKEEKIGTVLIAFNMQSVLGFSRYAEDEKLPAILAFDREEKLVFSSAGEDIDASYGLYFDMTGQPLKEEIMFGNQVYYIDTSGLDMLDGKLVFLISQKEALSGMEKLQKWMVIFEIITVITLLFLCVMFMKRIIHPLNQFMDWLSELKKGNLKLMKQHIMLKGATEVEVMAEQFNGMMEEINELTHHLVDTASKLYESELERRQAELEYMYSQVNPHFLFNTLESVKGCAIEEKAQRTFSMVNALGKIFRYCVRSGNMVSLREEVGVADSYMHLQQIRFEKRLTYYNRVCEDVLEAVIPKMILQPLLENAVIHGVEEDGASIIWLDGCISDGVIILTVTDDGTGVSVEKRAELRDRLEKKGDSSHIGISNIYNRLRYIYGAEYGLELMEMESGFGVRIKIPLNCTTSVENR